MEKKRPQLNPDDLHRLKWLTGGSLILLSVSTVFYLEMGGWSLMWLTALAVLLAMIKPELVARVPRMVHRMAFPVIVVVFASDWYLTSEVLPALVRLDMLLLLYRGITYRKRRDDLQVIVLGLFLIVLAGVVTVSLLFAAQILAFSACALGFMLLITLVQAGGSEEEEDVPGWVTRSRKGLWGRMRAATDVRVVLLGMGLFGGLVVLSGLLFMAIPRVELQNNLFLERFMTKQAKTGFSDRISFGDVTDIRQDNSVAVSIDVTDPSQIPADPYWRMVVLDEYKEATFRLSARLRQARFSRERTAATVRGQAPVQFREQDYWTFYMEAGVSRYLPLAGHFEILRFRDRQHFQEAESLGIIALRNEPVSMTAYRVEGMRVVADLADAEFGAIWREARLNETVLPQLEIDLSEQDQRVLEQVITEAGAGVQREVTDFVEKVSAWLGGRHVYGLQSDIPEGAGDPLVRWLVSSEPGHCELFAGAMVMLARTAGIPARVVTGFKGGSWNGFSGNFTLRNADAHAWCELYDEKRERWMRVDPTPGAAVTSEENSLLSAVETREVDRSWAARFDSLRVFWYRRIVNFDQQSQVETINAVKEATQDAGRRLREWLQTTGERIREWLAQPWDGQRWLRIAGGVGLLGGLIFGVIRLMQAWQGGRWRGSKRMTNRVRSEAGRWLRRLPPQSADHELRRDLERLRYGDERNWPVSDPVFHQAREEWRRAKTTRPR